MINRFYYHKNSNEEPRKFQELQLTADVKQLYEEPSEFDIDEYLLGNKKNEQDSYNFALNKESYVGCKSNIVVNAFDENAIIKTNTKLNQHHPTISNELLLLPHYNRCNTGDRNSFILKHQNSANSKVAAQRTDISKTMKGLSQGSAGSRFISPVLKLQNKNKMFKRPGVFDDSEISEHLPSLLLSMPSANENNVLEEVIEFQTKENTESNLLQARLQVEKRRPSNFIDGSSNNYDVTFKQRIQLQSKPFEQAISTKYQKSRTDPTQTFGNIIKWTKGGRIGFGVFGDVIKAMNKATGEIIAVKRLGIIKNQDEYNKEAIDALKSEINILKEVEHENIIRYIGAEIIKDDFGIYLEYASKGSLLDLYREFGAFEEVMILNYTRQILNGIVHLHNKMIVHQDLKGANVLLTGNDVIKISDFGCARQIEKSMSGVDLYKSLRGTVPWMAPEVLKQKSSNGKADIWSLGGTIIEMAIGGNPWGNHDIGNNIEDLFKLADRFGHPDIPPHLSDDLKDFLSQGFVLDYRKRPSADKLLEHKWLSEK